MRENKHNQIAGFFLFLSVILACSSVQCKRKEPSIKTVESTIVEQCKKRFSFDVTAQKKGMNLAVSFNTQNLFNDKKRKLKINRIILCANDVLTHYRSKIAFLHILIRDETSGVENRYIWTMNDIQKSIINIISPKEFRSRALMTADNNLYLLGSKRTAHFFELLPSHTLKDILKIHPRITLKIFSKGFFHHLLETSMKENSKYDILSARTKALSNNKMLFYYRVRHSFEPKSGFQGSSFKYTTGNIINFVFGVEDVSYLDVRISEIYTFGDNETFASLDISKVLKNCGKPKDWLEKDFFVENIDKADFVARLIAQKVSLRLNSKGETQDKKSNIKNINGTFEQSNGKPIFQIVFQANNSSDNIPFDEITAICTDAARQVCEIYNFKDFESISLFFPEKGIFKTIEKKEIGL